MNNGFADLVRQDVEFGWGDVGGVDPSPFRVLIPAGCFVANFGFHVADPIWCGVQMIFDANSGSVPLLLSFSDSEARLRTRRNGTSRFDMQARCINAGQAHAILDALGGAATEMLIGTENGDIAATESRNGGRD